MTLNPCPFCGSPANCDRLVGYDLWEIECSGLACGVRMLSKRLKKTAVAAWNKRVTKSRL